jgi:diaminopimelate epimerase
VALMRVEFIKMHGLGNDFVVLDARAAPLPGLTPSLIRALGDRHRGIGFDQLILIEPAPDSDQADCAVRFYNQDGGESGACGNGTRAVGLLLGQPARIATSGGILLVHPEGAGVSVDLPAPRTAWDQIPLAFPMDTLTMPVGWDTLEQPCAVNVGNPHVVFFVPDNDVIQLDRIGPEIEHDPLFPERVNVNVATIEDRRTIRLRVWERGAGLTRACGTGACATAIAAMRRGLADRSVQVHQPGGTLYITWGEDGRITMSGPAAESFRGSFNWADFA